MRMTAKPRGRRGRRDGGIAAVVLVAALLGHDAGAQPPAQAANAGWRVFRDPALGFSFSYPPGWTARVGCHASRSCVGIANGKRDVDDYTLALEVFPGGLERTATQKSVFSRGARGWVANGRSSEHPVEPMAGEGWSGLQAVVDCGTGDQSGVHPAAGECLWAVLSNGTLAVVADTQGSAPIVEEVRQMIRSVRFVRR
jgi:hypothetical protein